jgi:hypothetical protein
LWWAQAEYLLMTKEPADEMMAERHRQ